MRMRFREVPVAVVALTLSSTAVAGQLRTAEGRPNLQGIWDFQTMTPLERPAGEEREFLSDEEVAKLAEDTKERLEQATRPTAVWTALLPAGGDGRTIGYTIPPFLDSRTNVVGSHRTSLLIDPPNGRLPALTPDGEALRQGVRLFLVGGPERSTGLLRAAWQELLDPSKAG